MQSRGRKNLAGYLCTLEEDGDDATALWFRDRRYSRRDLARSVAALSARLSRGAYPDGAVGRVAVIGRNCPELVVAINAVWHSGGCAVLVNPHWESDTLRSAIGSAGVDRAIVTDEVSVSLPSGMHSIEYLKIGDENQISVEEKLPAEVTGTDDAVIIFTGGTTGTPKGAVHSFASIGGTVSRQVDLLRAGRSAAREGKVEWSSHKVNLLPLPIFHMSGLLSLLFAFAVKRAVALMEKFEPKEYVELASRFKVDNFFGTPTMYDMLCDLPDEHIPALPALRIAMSGAAQLRPDTRERFRAKFGVPILQTYGQTELTHIAGWDPRDLDQLERRPNSVGKPYPGVDLQIVDAEGNELPDGEVGEIAVTVESRMSRYIGQEGDLPQESGGRIRTGDLGYCDEDGYLYITGRRRETIICGGFNVYPSDLEEVLGQHPAVYDVVVLGVPDARLGEVPVALVVLRSQQRSVTSEELVAYTRRRVPHYAAVRRVYVVDALPSGAALKTKRGEARAWIEELESERAN